MFQVRRFQMSRTAFAVMPNCVAISAAKVSRTSRSALASKIWIACTHIQAEYVCNVPECIASNQFSCRHRALRSVPHALIHHTCSPLSVVAGLGARLACAAMRGPARTRWNARLCRLVPHFTLMSKVVACFNSFSKNSTFLGRVLLRCLSFLGLVGRYVLYHKWYVARYVRQVCPISSKNVAIDSIPCDIQISVQ